MLESSLETEISKIPLVMTKEQLDNIEHKILYRQVKSVKAGDIERFKIHFTHMLKEMR